MPSKGKSQKITRALLNTAHRQNSVFNDARLGKTIEQIARRRERQPRNVTRDVQDLIESTKGKTQERLRALIDPKFRNTTERIRKIAKKHWVEPNELYNFVGISAFDKAVAELKQDRGAAERKLRRRIELFNKKIPLEADLLRKNLMTVRLQAIKSALAKFGIEP